MIEIDTTNSVARLDPRYLSFTVDTSQVLSANGTFDFSRARLKMLAKELAPAMLRIGGIQADGVFYDLSENPVTSPPDGFERITTRATWDGVCDFAEELGLQILFTLNAGPGPRNGSGDWDPSNARSLIEYTRSRGCPVEVWELGNEINAYIVVYGVSAAIDGAQYAADMARQRQLVDEVDPDARIAGPASAYFPLLGEIVPILPTFLDVGGESIDIVTWHYYPQQSSNNCPIQSRPAEAETLLSPTPLDGIALWAEEVEVATAAHAPQAEVWLAETSHAQCGG